MQPLAVFYGEPLRRYAFPEGHPFSVKRVEGYWKAANEAGILASKVAVYEPVKAGEEDLLTFHIPEYVNFVKKA